MTRLARLVFLIWVGFLTCSQCGELSFKTKEVKLGAAYAGIPKSFKFKCYNSGTRDLHIDKVKLSCGGCLEYSLSSRTVKPKSSVTVTGKYTGKGKGADTKVMYFICSGAISFIKISASVNAKENAPKISASVNAQNVVIVKNIGKRDLLLINEIRLSSGEMILAKNNGFSLKPSEEKKIPLKNDDIGDSRWLELYSNDPLLETKILKLKK